MKIILLIMTICITILNSSDITIDQQIAAIKSAPKEQRVTLMNTFKQQLFQLNQTQRLTIIKKLMKSNNISTPITTLNDNITTSEITNTSIIQQIDSVNNIEQTSISQTTTTIQNNTTYSTTNLYDCNKDIK